MCTNQATNRGRLLQGIQGIVRLADPFWGGYALNSANDRFEVNAKSFHSQRPHRKLRRKAKERFSVTHNGTATTDTGYRDAIARCSLEPSDTSASACAYVQTCGR